MIVKKNSSLSISFPQVIRWAVRKDRWRPLWASGNLAVVGRVWKPWSWRSRRLSCASWRPSWKATVHTCCPSHRLHLKNQLTPVHSLICKVNNQDGRDAWILFLLSRCIRLFVNVKNSCNRVASSVLKRKKQCIKILFWPNHMQWVHCDTLVECWSSAAAQNAQIWPCACGVWLKSGLKLLWRFW